MKTWFGTLRQALTCPLGVDPAEQGKHGRTLREDLRCLYPFLKKHRRIGSLSASLTLVAALIALPQPLINRQFIDRALLQREFDYLPLILLFTALIGLSSLLLNLLREWFTKHFEQRMDLDLQESLYGHLLRLPKPFFENPETALLVGRVKGDVGIIRWFYSTPLINAAVQIVQFLGSLALLLSLHWRMTLLLLVWLPLGPAIIYFLSRRMHHLGEVERQRHSGSLGAAGESLTAVSLIKSCTAENRTLRELLSAIKAIGRTDLQQITLNQVSQIAAQMGPAIARFAVLCFGGYSVIRGEWSLGSLAAFQSYMGFLFAPSQALAGMSVPFQNARTALERLNRFFHLLPEENHNSGKRVSRLIGAVQFRGLSFSYDRGAPIIERLDLRIEPGEHVAIVGPSGIGKTTLISLILRFYRPTSGEIFFDGEPASAYEIRSLRRRIGFMAQQTVLLSISILENVRYGNPDASLEEVRAACRSAGIEDFVESLPGGFETVIGPKGLILSAGQAQRLSLARALVKDPDILLLDEPTSAVDLVTEQSIFDSLPALIKGKTLFIVAHRLSTIKDCTRILLFDQNRLIASGTHDSLLQSHEYYRRLIEIQQSAAAAARWQGSLWPSSNPPANSFPERAHAGAEAFCQPALFDPHLPARPSPAPNK